MTTKSLKQLIKDKNTSERITGAFFVISIALLLVFIIQFFIYWLVIDPYNPISVPLFFRDHGDSFMDFFNVNDFVSDNDPYVQGGSSYPPLVLAIAKLFSLIADYSKGPFVARLSFFGIFSCILFFLPCLVCLYLVLKRYAKDNNKSGKKIILLFALFFFSAPMLYLLQRGNYLILSLLLTAVFLVFRNHSNKAIKELSYISLAVAVGIKLYPAVFAVFLLKEKKILPLIRTALYSVLLLILPFVFFKGGFSNIPVFVDNLLDFSKGLTPVIIDGEFQYALPPHNPSLTSMLYLIFKLIIGFNYNTSPAWLPVVSNAALAVFGISLIFAMLFSNKRWKIAAACSLIIVLLPNPSYVYTMVFLFLPCVAFLFEGKKTSKDWIYMSIFVILFLPVQFGFIMKPQDSDFVYGFTVSNFVQGIILIAFAVMITADSASALMRKVRAGREKTSVDLAAA